MKNNQPLWIGLAVVAVLIAAVIIWKTMSGYDQPPPITTSGPGAKMSAPAGEKPTNGVGSGGLSMPGGAPGGGPPGGGAPGGGGMTIPTPPPTR